MNKRSFLKTLGLGLASFAILPSATTYSRLWKPTRRLWRTRVITYNVQTGVFKESYANMAFTEFSRAAKHIAFPDPNTVEVWVPEPTPGYPDWSRAKTLNCAVVGLDCTPQMPTIACTIPPQIEIVRLDNDLVVADPVVARLFTECNPETAVEYTLL